MSKNRQGRNYATGLYDPSLVIVTIGGLPVRGLADQDGAVKIKESADELQRLAEIFEVREALARFPAIGGVVDLIDIAAVGGTAELAERLHAAGWRPGDSAERAAELLAGGTR